MVLHPESLRASLLLVFSFAPFTLAQQQIPSPTPSAPAQTAQPVQTAPAPSQAEVMARDQAESQARFPQMLTSGGISVQLTGWLTEAKPVVQGGASSTATTLTGFDYPHERRYVPGIEVSMPAGSSNTLRFSYFRLLGQGDTYSPAQLTIFGTGYNPGDLMNAAYTMQNLKASWDFLTYTVAPHTSKLRVKTLWEVQYLKINSVIDAPLVQYAALASGNTALTTAEGEKNFIYPSLGIGLEQNRSRHFRWEAKASGFGIAHHPGILDAEVAAVLQTGRVDTVIGGRYFYFKTSPQSDEYFHTALWGPSLAFRWYWFRGTE